MLFYFRPGPSKPKAGEPKTRTAVRGGRAWAQGERLPLLSPGRRRERQREGGRERKKKTLLNPHSDKISEGHTTGGQFTNIHAAMLTVSQAPPCWKLAPFAPVVVLFDLHLLTGLGCFGDASILPGNAPVC